MPYAGRMTIPKEHTLAGVDNDLLQETLGALQAGDMSVALHMLREDEATVVAKNLKAAVIASKCECTSA
ncbi:MAG TPA: hypothetical protein VGN11_12215, partial [Candidatus Baltobacteraceae bacterium]|nr:hypothetical protein [Candidatus Baltobacteraceae bacterium]